MLNSGVMGRNGLTETKNGTLGNGLPKPARKILLVGFFVVIVVITIEKRLSLL